MIFNTIKSAVEIGRHLPRYREILRVLHKYGFGEVLKLVVLQNILKIQDVGEPVDASPVDSNDILSQPLPVRIRMALEELGPTFIKFGQIISSRRDLVTDDFYRELVKLQNNVPPFPSAEGKKIIREELGKSVDRLFRTFDDEPIGGASMAQVYKARLHSGKVVAVKVRRPGIDKVIDLDVSILRDLAGFVERHSPELATLNPCGVVEEFSETLLKELDFENEAAHTERFTRQFKDDPRIHTPKIYREFTSPRVLTMEFISGIRVDDLAKLKANGIDPVALSERISVLIYRQIFEFGFFHADPHPGNMTILPEGVIGLYDFGMMGTFSRYFRESIAKLIIGLVEKDHKQTMRSLLDMSEEGVVDDPSSMLADVEKFSDQNLSKPLKDIQLGVILNQLLELLRDHHLRMKSNFYLGIKALSQVEATGQALNPELDFVLLGEPYAMHVLVGKYAPKRLWKIGKHFLAEMADLLQDLPHDFRNAYNNLRLGRYHIPLEHKIDPKGFEPLRITMDSIANRLSIAILTASVLVCASIVTHAKVPPLYNDVSVPGAIGLICGIYMGLRIAWSIWKHGGL